MLRRLAYAILAFAASICAVQAQEENEFARRTSTEFMTSPRVSETEPGGIFAAAGRFIGLLQLDNVATPASGAPFSSLYAESELRGYVSITQLFTINGLIHLEQVRDQQAGGAFVDENLYVQRLFAVVNAAPLHVYGGKIHPRFGMGWYATPGLYGSDVAEEYELREKLGFGIRADIRTLGRHRLTLETFQADTSFLSGSLIPGPQPGDPQVKRQARRSLASGGVSNTGALDSFAAALSSRRIPGLPGFGTDIGRAMQKASPLEVRDEYSWVVGATWQFPLTKTTSLAPLAEFTSVKGQAGANRDVDYLTLAANLRIDALWAVAVHTTERFVRDYAAGDYRTDWMAGAGVAYDLGERFKESIRWLNGFSLLAGFRHDRRLGTDRETIGLQLRYERDL